jgi:hypothetical protein
VLQLNPLAPTATSTNTTPFDTTMYDIIHQNNLIMQQWSATLTAAIQVLTAQLTTTMNQALKTKPSIDFPTWDGDSSNLQDFFSRSTQ